MTPILLRAAIMASTQSARAFALLIGSDERTVRRWLAGDRKTPGPVVTLCRLVIVRPSIAKLMQNLTQNHRLLEALAAAPEAQE